MAFKLPPLPYDYGALEPYIDAQTMEIHHTKHHQGYVNNLNAALEKHPDFQGKSLNELLEQIKNVPEDIRIAVRNHGGGHSNHSFFWPLMKKGGGGKAVGIVSEEINKRFGSFEAFQDQFNAAAKNRFGSGWAWLCMNSAGNLEVSSTSNQDSPLMEGLKPILGLDVWEHAYYLKYQNRRPDYIQAFWQVINWDQVEQNYEELG